MKYKNTLVDFRDYFESNYPNDNWFDVIKPLYYAYSFFRANRYSTKYSHDDAIKALRYYLDFYQIITGEKYLTYPEIMEYCKENVFTLPAEKRAELTASSPNNGVFFGINYFLLHAGTKDAHVGVIENKYYVKVYYISPFLDELFESEADSDTGLFLSVLD